MYLHNIARTFRVILNRATQARLGCAASRSSPRASSLNFLAEFLALSTSAQSEILELLSNTQIAYTSAVVEAGPVTDKLLTAEDKNTKSSRREPRRLEIIWTIFGSSEVQLNYSSLSAANSRPGEKNKLSRAFARAYKIICFPPERPVESVSSARTRVVPRQVRRPNHPRRSHGRQLRASSRHLRRRSVLLAPCGSPRISSSKRPLTRPGRR